MRCVRTSYAHTYVRMRIHSLQMVAAYGKEYSLPEVNQMAATLRSALLDIQEGRVPDPFGWVIDPRDREALAALLEK